MKRWLAKLTIGTYLTALALGIVSHAMNFGTGAHPVMYYLVWDMFCGWSAHELRYHIVGESESGQYYKLTPAPWSTFAPYGDLERAQYDALGNSYIKIAMNTLRHTEHEPISRIYVIEEAWPKKYNLPDNLWAAQFDEPKDAHSYFHLKSIYDGDGMALQILPDYITTLQRMAVTNNPRLRADSLRGRPFFAVEPTLRGTYLMEPQSTLPPESASSEPSWNRPSAN